MITLTKITDKYGVFQGLEGQTKRGNYVNIKQEGLFTLIVEFSKNKEEWLNSNILYKRSYKECNTYNVYKCLSLLENLGKNNDYSSFYDNIINFIKEKQL
jgi:hypothetical protein